MDQTARSRETLRRLALLDEGFVGSQAGLELGRAGTAALDGKTVALLRLAASIAAGAPAACVQWAVGRAVSAGAADDEIANVLLAIAPVAGLSRVACATPEVATALEYDLTAALEEG